MTKKVNKREKKLIAHKLADMWKYVPIELGAIQREVLSLR